MDAIQLRTKGPSEFDRRSLFEAIAASRDVFEAQLRTLGADEWTAPTRNAAWNVHDTVRHLADTATVARDRFGADHNPFDGFDPRVTPKQWLEGSAGESPEETLLRLEKATDSVITAAYERFDAGMEFSLDAPYGPMPWEVLVLHWYWDRWVHEADILLPLGRSMVTPDEAAFPAMAYGVFIAGAVAGMFAVRTEVALALGGSGGGSFSLTVDEGVTLVAERRAQDGPAAVDVAAALSGRGTPLAELVPGLDDVQVTALTGLGTFLASPG